MKKLYQDIERIHIKGGIGQLSEMVRIMDISLQNIADNTDQLVNGLARYSASNKGAQYEKVVLSSLELRDEMFEAAVELNEKQRQVVVFQNKIYRFEGRAESASIPAPFLAVKRRVDVDTKYFQFERSEMVELVSLLKNYKGSVSTHYKRIVDSKNALGAVWKDEQYRDFSGFIDDVTKRVDKAIRTNDEFVTYLENKINEMG